MTFSANEFAIGVVVFFFVGILFEKIGQMARDHNEEDARLITSETDMLEALLTIKRLMYEPRALMIEEVEGIIDTAIAKAMGR